MVAQGSLEPLVLVRIQAGQPIRMKSELFCELAKFRREVLSVNTLRDTLNFDDFREVRIWVVQRVESVVARTRRPRIVKVFPGGFPQRNAIFSAIDSRIL